MTIHYTETYQKEHKRKYRIGSSLVDICRKAKVGDLRQYTESEDDYYISSLHLERFITLSFHYGNSSGEIQKYLIDKLNTNGALKSNVIYLIIHRTPIYGLHINKWVLDRENKNRSDEIKNKTNTINLLRLLLDLYEEYLKEVK